MLLKSLPSILLPLGLVLFLTACAGHNVPTGRWTTDDSVRKFFEEGRIYPDHTYYYLGSITAPDSIIAIDNRYTLRTRVWAEIAISQQVFNGWLTWYRTDNFGPCPLYGGVILTPAGRPAGYWYSRNTRNIVEEPEPGVLVVYQPDSNGFTRCGRQDDDHGFLGLP